jgi:hypothetical protein
VAGLAPRRPKKCSRNCTIPATAGRAENGLDLIFHGGLF